MQLTKKEAKRLGLLDEDMPANAVERHSQPRRRKSGGVSIPRAGRAAATGLSTLIKAGWSVQSPDSVRHRLYKINQPAMDTGLCVDELTACNKAKALERTR